MTVTDTSRDELLETYGRWFGEERFAIAFTSSTEGEDAKRVTTQGWDKTAPLASADFGASYVRERGKTKNPVIVLRPSNLIVLECDTEDDLLRIEDLELPLTITVRSSKPYKRHYYFRPPAELDQLPYVAFRFESGKLNADSGRYFLAPPSIHPSGAIYAFLPDRGPDEADIAELPPDTYLELARHAKREIDEMTARIHVDPGAKVQAGQRADRIFRYASMLRRWGLTRQQILEQALQWNEDRCDPPIERRRVEMQVDGAMKMDGDQEIAHALEHPLPDDDHNPLLDIDVTSDENVDSWAPINLAQLETRPPIRPTLGQAGIAYPGKRHVFSGPQESAKTLAAYAVGLEVIRGGQPIVVIDFEMGKWDARDRLRELGATNDDLALLHYVEPEEQATLSHIARLIALRAALVIIDAAAGAYDIQGLDDNKRQDVERFTRIYVRDFWRNGIATIVLDHVVKNTETRGKYAIGSERKVGGADVHLGFEVITPIKRGTSGIYKITTHKDRGGFLERGRLADLHLHSAPDTHQITWEFKAAEHLPEGETFRPTALMEKVSRYLETHTEPVSRNNVETTIKGKRAEFIRKALDALVNERFVTQSTGAHNSKLVSSERPYRQAEDPKSDSSSSSSHLVPSSSDEESTTSSSSSPSTEGNGRGDWDGTNPARPELDAQDQAFIDQLEIDRLEQVARDLGLDGDDG